MYLLLMFTPLSLFLSELKLSVSVSLVESIIDEVLQDLSVAQEKLVRVCIYECVYCAHENCVCVYDMQHISLLLLGQAYEGVFPVHQYQGQCSSAQGDGA